MDRPAVAVIEIESVIIATRVSVERWGCNIRVYVNVNRVVATPSQKRVVAV